MDFGGWIWHARTVAGDSGDLQIWQVSDGALLHRLPARSLVERYETGVVAIVFSPDGRLLVTGGTDGTVRLWGVKP